MSVEPSQVPAAEPPPNPAPTPSSAPGAVNASDPQTLSSDLLALGAEEMLKGADTGTLAAFAALAYQQIRGSNGLPHQNLGCSILLFSVLMCALVHIFVGNAYVGRARQLLGQYRSVKRHRAMGRASLGAAWFAAAVEFVGLFIGIYLVLLEEPPAFLRQLLGI